jgi:hypothetical protein
MMSLVTLLQTNGSLESLDLTHNDKRSKRADNSSWMGPSPRNKMFHLFAERLS